jgi:diguanylate cyclase (GGDEF)-like protein
MLDTFRESDVVGRLGGDEFVAMLSDSDQTKADEILSRFAEAVEAANKEMNKPYKIQYSVGLKHFAYDTKLSAEEMIQDADAAMYVDKNNNR